MVRSIIMTKKMAVFFPTVAALCSSHFLFFAKAISQTATATASSTTESTLQQQNRQIDIDAITESREATASATNSKAENFVLAKWSLVSKSFALLGEKTRQVTNAQQDLKQLELDMDKEDNNRKQAVAIMKQENEKIVKEIAFWKEKLAKETVKNSKSWTALNGTLDLTLFKEEQKLLTLERRRSEKIKEYKGILKEMETEKAELEEEVGNFKDKLLTRDPRTIDQDEKEEVEEENANTELQLLQQKFGRIREKLLLQIQAEKARVYKKQLELQEETAREKQERERISELEREKKLEREKLENQNCDNLETELKQKLLRANCAIDA